MADINQIIDAKLVAELVRLNKELIAAGTNVDKIIPILNELNNVQQKLTKGVNDDVDANKKLIAAQKELDSINKQIITTDAKINSLTIEASKLLAEQKLKLQQATQAQKDKVKAEQGAEGSLVRMRARLKELTTEYVRAGTRTKAATKQILDLRNEIAKAEMAIGTHGREVGNYGKIWNGLKSMLPIASFAALGTAVVGTFNAIKNSTEATADKFEFAVAGMKTGLDQFWKTLATGDWSNFTDRMNEAIKAGYEYAKALDFVQDATRSLSLVESDMMKENTELEIQLRNRNLSPEEQKKLGEKRIENEKKLVEDRVLIANKAYNAEEKEILRQTKLSKEQLEIVAKDIQSQKKLDAEAYNEKVSQYEKMRKLNTTTVGGGGVGGGSVIQLADTPEMIMQKKEIEATAVNVKEYAKLLNDYDISTEQSKDKFAAAYIAKKEAENSGLENTRKVYWLVNNLSKQIADEVKSSSEKATAARTKAAEAEKKLSDERIKKWADETWWKAEQKLIQQKIDEKYLEDFAKLIDDELELEDAKQEKIIAATIAAGEKILNEKQKLSDAEKEQRLKNEEDFKQAAIQQGQELGNYLFESKKKQLELEFQAAEGNEKRQSEIKKKIAEADKKQALFNIAVNTAVAVSKVLGQTGIFGLAAWIPVAALGAVQAAMVAAQKIPKFSKGTDYAPGGMAVVGEKGRELIQTPRGQIYLANNPALVNLERGSKVINNSKTEAYLNDGNIVSELRQTRKAIQRMPQPVFLNGSKIAERRNGYWKEYLNAKHRSN